MNKLLVEIGNRISSRRRLLGYTQEQVADMMDVSIQMISNLERGNKAIRPQQPACGDAERQRHEGAGGPGKCGRGAEGHLCGHDQVRHWRRPAGHDRCGGTHPHGLRQGNSKTFLLCGEPQQDVRQAR